jgi:hypothetical protein
VDCLVTLVEGKGARLRVVYYESMKRKLKIKPEDKDAPGAVFLVDQDLYFTRFVCVYLQLDLKKTRVKVKQCHSIPMMHSKPVKVVK